MTQQPIAGPSSSQMSMYTSFTSSQGPSTQSTLPPNQPPLPLATSYSPTDASMSELLLSPLTNLQNLAQSLTIALSSTQARPIAPPPLEAFLAVDATLANAVQLSRIHQVKQRKIERLKNEVLEMEGKWREIVESLEKGKLELEEVIEEGEKRIKSIQEAKAGSIPYPELLAYAQSLSAFTSAPPNMPEMMPGQPPPPLFFPPFPNEEKMRRGRMNNEESLGPLGETHSVGRRVAASPPKSVGYPAPGAGPGINPYRPDNRQPMQVFDLDLDLNPDL